MAILTEEELGRGGHLSSRLSYHYIWWEEQGPLVSAGGWKETPAQKWHLTPVTISSCWETATVQTERGGRSSERLQKERQELTPQLK